MKDLLQNIHYLVAFLANFTPIFKSTPIHDCVSDKRG